jgi:hypothetical protein
MNAQQQPKKQVDKKRKERKAERCSSQAKKKKCHPSDVSQHYLTHYLHVSLLKDGEVDQYELQEILSKTYRKGTLSWFTVLPTTKPSI